jgi:hypothetical protein
MFPIDRIEKSNAPPRGDVVAVLEIVAGNKKQGNTGNTVLPVLHQRRRRHRGCCREAIDEKHAISHVFAIASPPSRSLPVETCSLLSFAGFGYRHRQVSASVAVLISMS